MPQRRYREYYETLGVHEGASLDEVRRAYRRRAREVHPDLNPGDPQAEQRQRELNEAYRALCTRLSAGSEMAEPPAEGHEPTSSWVPRRAYEGQAQVPPWAPFGRSAAPGTSWGGYRAAPWHTRRSPAEILALLVGSSELDLGSWPRRTWADEVLEETLAALVELTRRSW